ncbi:TOM1-like protein 2 isoform X2 [Callorhinchus milii]|uniref:Target of myb1 membrane trafficking protein n=1 Tax=Callorhinchus milii TaxID=7868 RepID=A0A4W3HAX4_CALMI|nr:TOM1-like protein 2 isoform X2 [Callorhinchus milii]|eukprot:gi/632983064/ref/XP_007908463.1/ PREDICTED: TOM1-like protein 2 isoform X1 [Callorhinchus milii]
MEFLYGSPYSSPVGQRIEQATDGSLQAEDWGLNIEICDIINETEEGPKDAIRALRKRLAGNKNFREVMLCLTVLETCVKNCGHRFHVLVASRDFVEGVLVKTILPKNNPPNVVQDKVLSLIQAWADAFRSTPDLTGVVAMYEELRRKGLEFPMTDLDALSPIHTPQRSIPEVDPAETHNAVPLQPPAPAVYPASELPIPGASADGAITPSLEQIAKLRGELDVVNGNVKVMSEMLTEMVPGQEDSSDLELLQELNRTCRAMQQRLLELISRVTNEQVTEELLHVNDNLNNVFLRYDRFERFRTGQNAVNSVLIGTENPDSLIDLTPNSPAIVSPVPASALSTQLAGLNVAGDDVSGTLKSLEPNVTAKTEEEEFDMFAQTRSSSLADQRKNVKYEDPQAIEGLAGALDTRQHNTGATESTVSESTNRSLDSWMTNQGMIPVTQACLMEDIEQWLSTDVKDELGDDAEGVTSEEFDKFLEERAKAAEMLPTLPSPPSEPPRSLATSKKTKQEKTEDALFSL